MKRALLLAFIFGWTSAQAAKIPLIHDGGIYLVPVIINDRITLNFALDSGAADVSVPADVFSTLVRAGTIAKSDLLDQQAYTLADGSVQHAQRFRIRSLKLGEVELKGVIGSVVPSAGTLLLGQSFLQRFKTWGIDNQQHVLVINDTVNAPASSSETSSSQPEQSSTEPSLSETINFVRSKLYEQGRIEFTKFAHNEAENYRFTNFESDSFAISSSGCTGTIEQTESIDRSGADTQSFSVPFGNIKKIEVATEMEAENSHASRFITDRTTPQITRLTLRYSQGTRATGLFPILMFYDQDMAQRVAKAIAHAVELCGGSLDEKKEPF